MIPVVIEKATEIKLEKPFSRIFHYNESLLLVESESYSILKTQQLDDQKNVKFDVKLEDMEKITLSNFTPSKYKFTR